MTNRERIELIRKGNQLFNEGKIEDAAKIFLVTDYKDGLVRVGDHYLYQEKRFFKAFFYYKKANYSKRLNEIYKKWAEIIHFLLEEDKKMSNQSEGGNTNITTDDNGIVKKYDFPRLDTR
ncbi:MAG: hypothetical protein N2712_01560 [Brevinematales bacterium]|nr:hypothetical protein [Brevinematales bacterium]